MILILLDTAAVNNTDTLMCNMCPETAMGPTWRRLLQNCKIIILPLQRRDVPVFPFTDDGFSLLFGRPYAIARSPRAVVLDTDPDQLQRRKLRRSPEIEDQIGRPAHGRRGVPPVFSAAGNSATAILATVVTAMSRQINCHQSPPTKWPGSQPVTSDHCPVVDFRSQFRLTGVLIAGTIITVAIAVVDSIERDPHRTRLAADRRRRRWTSSAFGPNSSRPRQPLPPPTAPSPSPSCGLSNPTTGQPWGATDHRNLFGLPSPPASHLLGSIPATPATARVSVVPAWWLSCYQSFQPSPRSAPELLLRPLVGGRGSVAGPTSGPHRLGSRSNPTHLALTDLVRPDPTQIRSNLGWFHRFLPFVHRF